MRAYILFRAHVMGIHPDMTSVQSRLRNLPIKVDLSLGNVSLWCSVFYFVPLYPTYKWILGEYTSATIPKPCNGSNGQKRVADHGQHTKDRCGKWASDKNVGIPSRIPFNPS